MTSGALPVRAELAGENASYALDDALEACRTLEARELTGRAVVVPHGRG